MEDMRKPPEKNTTWPKETLKGVCFHPLLNKDELDKGEMAQKAKRLLPQRTPVQFLAPTGWLTAVLVTVRRTKYCRKAIKLTGPKTWLHLDIMPVTAAWRSHTMTVHLKLLDHFPWFPLLIPPVTWCILGTVLPPRWMWCISWPLLWRRP